MDEQNHSTIWLPYFQPPQQPIKVGDFLIKCVSDNELSDTVKIYGRGTLSDIRQLQKKRMDEISGQVFWTVVDNFNSSIPDTSFITLLELLTDQWKNGKLFYPIRYRNVVPNPIYSFLEIPGGEPVSFTFSHIFIENLSAAITLLQQTKFQVVLHRWRTSYDREDYLDAILDCCSTLEALIPNNQEIRLRLSLIAGMLVDNRKDIRRSVYDMYGKRNDFIHGSDIPYISREEIIQYMDTTAAVLKSVCRNGLMPKKEQLDKEIVEI